jgi:hypothetical protein
MVVGKKLCEISQIASIFTDTTAASDMPAAKALPQGVSGKAPRFA